ncbi:MAG TPA: CPBP family intramembrane glutamic endopeptidase [Thermoanaerobaculia bacterium]|nr:CPBP family intramembrane glutamic endopeptidase [Thermoanaerobaculia bacterium]
MPNPRWHPLFRSVLFLIAFILVQAAATLLVAFAGNLLGREGGYDPLGASYLIVFAVTAPLLLFVTRVFVRHLDRRDLASLGARWPDGGRPRALRQSLTVPVSTLGLVAAWAALVSWLGDLHFERLSGDFQHGLSWLPGPVGSVGLLVLILLGFLIQGGVEEWVMRGYIYRALKERWPWWVSALVSAGLFSALHALNPDVSGVALFNIVLAGVLLAELVERSGSLWSATLAHGVWNFAIACLVSLPISGVPFFRVFDASIAGPDLVTGGAFGPEGSLLLSGLALVLIALLWPRRPARVAEAQASVEAEVPIPSTILPNTDSRPSVP